MELTLEEVNALAMLLSRAPVNWIEMQWANDLINRLQAMAVQPAQEPERPNTVQDDHGTEMP